MQISRIDDSGEQQPDAVLCRQRICVEMKKGRERRFVGVGNAREGRQPARIRLLVETFRIPAATNVQRGIDEDFVESRLPDDFGRGEPIILIGRHERDDAVKTCISHQSGNLRHAPHVLSAVLAAESKIPAESLAYNIAVDQVRCHAVRGESFMQGHCQGRFAGGRKACEPDYLSLCRLRLDGGKLQFSSNDWQSCAVSTELRC
jgi:hypothetical protein